MTSDCSIDCVPYSSSAQEGIGSGFDTDDYCALLVSDPADRNSCHYSGIPSFGNRNSVRGCSIRCEPDSNSGQVAAHCCKRPGFGSNRYPVGTGHSDRPSAGFPQLRW